MDKDLTEFFGRAKRISLSPQERKEIGQQLSAERKRASERHKECMKPADLMNTASAIGLSAREKKGGRKELQAFMRRNPPQKRPVTDWSPQAFIGMYVPIMAVTLIILANAQQLSSGVPSRLEPDQAPPLPLLEEVPATDEDETGVRGEDQKDAEVISQPAADDAVAPPPPPEPLQEQIQAEPAGEAEYRAPVQDEDPVPLTQPMQIEKSGEQDEVEMQRGTMPEVQSLEMVPDTMQMRSLKNEQSTESMDATMESFTAPTTVLAQIVAAEARLESLRIASEESEEASSLFKQAEQLLQKARTFAEKNTERALQYVQEAESLMDQLDAL